MYASSARSPEFGYLVTHVIVHGTVDVEKPALPQLPEEPGKPPPRRAGRSTGVAPARDAVRRDRDLPARVGDGRQLDRRPGDRRALARPPSRYRPGAARRSTVITSSTSRTWRRSRRWRSLTPRASFRARGAGIGWDGRRLDEMLAESERLFADTGHYGGLRELELMSADPIGYEKLFSQHPRRARVCTRDGAQHLRVADRARARRAVLRALHARGRLARAVDGHHRPRPHDVRRDQVDDPQRLRGQPRHPAGATSSRTTTRPSATFTTPTCRRSCRSSGRASLSPGRAASPRARHRREHAREACRWGPTMRYEDGIDLPCMKVGEHDELARWHLERCKKRTRASVVLPARRAHPSGRLPHDPRGGRAHPPRGGRRPASSASAARSSRRAGARSSRASAR